MGLKPSDEYCIPLKWELHAEQHRMGEEVFWGDSLEDVKKLATDLYANTGRRQVCIDLILKFRDRHRWRNLGEGVHS